MRLLQPSSGYRIGMDGALLAAACAGAIEGTGAGTRALELGSGVGGALLSLMMLKPEVLAIGIERESNYAHLGRQNLILNAATDRGQMIEADIAHGFKALGMERVDLVFSNPPYFDDPRRLRSPHLAKRSAWIADDGLVAWLGFAMAAVRDGGDIIFIHRADRLGDLLEGLSARCGSFVIRPIAPFEDAEAKRVIVRAKRLGKAPLRLLAPLILHEPGERKHAELVHSILYEARSLSWS